MSTRKQRLERVEARLGGIVCIDMEALGKALGLEEGQEIVHVDTDHIRACATISVRARDAFTLAGNRYVPKLVEPFAWPYTLEPEREDT